MLHVRAGRIFLMCRYALAGVCVVLMLDVHRVLAADHPAADRINSSRSEPQRPDSAGATSKPVVSAKVLRYAQRVIRQYDRNGDERLDQSEWAAMRGDPRQADLDGDGFIMAAELAQRVADYGWHRAIRLAASSQSAEPAAPARAVEADSPPAGPSIARGRGEASGDTGEQTSAVATGRRSLKYFVPAAKVQGLPQWFIDRDADGDGQITLAEFSPQKSKAQISEFAQYDLDGDGVITPQEYLRAIKNKPPAADAPQK